MASDTRRGSLAGPPAVPLPRALPAARSRLAAAGGGAVVANPVQADGDVRDQDQVVVAEDDLDLGAGQVQAQRPAGLGGDGDGPVAGLHRDEPQAPFHPARIHKSCNPGNMSSGKLVFMTETPGNGRPAAAPVPGYGPTATQMRERVISDGTAPGPS